MIIFRQARPGIGPIRWRGLLRRWGTALQRPSIHSRCGNAEMPHDAGRQVHDMNRIGPRAPGRETWAVDQQDRGLLVTGQPAVLPAAQPVLLVPAGFRR